MVVGARDDAEAHRAQIRGHGRQLELVQSPSQEYGALEVARIENRRFQIPIQASPAWRMSSTALNSGIRSAYWLNGRDMIRSPTAPP